MSYIQSPVVRFDPSNLSAFGTLEASELTPVVQGDFVYGLNTQLWNTPGTNGTGAAVDTSAGRLRLQSGTSSSSYAYITSRKIIRYRAGQGLTVRLTPLFTTGGASSLQLWGAGTIAANAPLDGYFFGYNGTSLGVVRYSGGAPTWAPQSGWNGDKCDGSAGTSFTWNPTFGTPAMIKFPFLGYGDIEFFLQNPATGRWVLVHVIQYANTTATTQLDNPSMQIMGFVANSGNTSNLTMYTGSVGAFLSGPRLFTANPRWAFDTFKTVAATETQIFNLKNCTTYNGVPNRGAIRINSISTGVSPSVNQSGVIRFKIGTAPGGSPSFTPINGTTADGGTTITAGNSIASTDVAGGTVATGVNYIFNLSFGGGSSAVDLTPFDIFINPGEILSVTGIASGNMASNLSVNWSEDT